MSQDESRARRWRSATMSALARVADARTGPRQSEATQARWAAHDFAVFSTALTVGYLVFVLTYDWPRLGSLVLPPKLQFYRPTSSCRSRSSKES